MGWPASWHWERDGGMVAILVREAHFGEGESAAKRPDLRDTPCTAGGQDGVVCRLCEQHRASWPRADGRKGPASAARGHVAIDCECRRRKGLDGVRAAGDGTHGRA